ncbi:MAG: hypothetical protein WA001_01130 [Patescibacteria group bacterium]
MPRISLTNRTIVIGAVVLLAVAALAWRLTSPSFKQPGTSSMATVSSASSTDQSSTSSSPIPAFTSARFDSGDALGALGPEWTFLRQTDTTDSNDYVPLAGMKSVRETVAKLIDKPTEMMFDEYTVMDAKALQQSLASPQVHKATINGRDGYIIPVGGIAGGTGFAIVGTDSVLLIQDANGAYWPTDVAPEVQSFIGAVRVL